MLAARAKINSPGTEGSKFGRASSPSVGEGRGHASVEGRGHTVPMRTVANKSLYLKVSMTNMATPTAL